MQATIGILMLDSQFPRIVGDVGNPATWGFTVDIEVVDNATPHAVVRQGDDMLDAFIEAGQRLVQRGVSGIITSCGFLSIYQQELASALGVPVLTSSLMQVASVNATLPVNKRAAILTISKSALKDKYLHAANVPLDTPIGSTEGGKEFSRRILNNEKTLNIELARQDNVNAAQALLATDSSIGALVLECTNMVPYAADIAAATGVPVYSMYNLVNWFQISLMPPEFGDLSSNHHVI
ncbi:MAG TPA: hypothetical protein DE045_00170 [Oceanospirillaceae bacterium]|nr:hypothetical protein [Oceanospirillaceae bacterium]